MPVALNFDLEPKEALAYLKNKGFELSFDYSEIAAGAHHKSFTVAKVMRSDILGDIHDALLDAQKSGKGFEAFKKELRSTLQRKGWWGERDIINPKTGEVKTIHVNAHRLRNIFNTNLRVSRNVARHRQMSRLTTMTYWRYSAILDRGTRADHAARHGTILPRENIWWQTNYPPNDWGCRCTVRAYSKKQIERRGWKVKSETPEGVASKDWAYDIGAGSRTASLQKLDLDKSLASLPVGTMQPKYEKMSERELLKTFYKTLQIEDGDTLIDRIGDPMVINAELFTNKKTDALKIKKADRHLLLDYFSKVLTDPDEIYLERAGNSWKKNMFIYLNVNGEKKAIMSVFRYFPDKTQGATMFYVTSELEKRRSGKLIYKKGREVD